MSLNISAPDFTSLPYISLPDPSPGGVVPARTTTPPHHQLRSRQSSVSQAQSVNQSEATVSRSVERNLENSDSRLQIRVTSHQVPSKIEQKEDKQCQSKSHTMSSSSPLAERCSEESKSTWVTQSTPLNQSLDSHSSDQERHLSEDSRISRGTPVSSGKFGVSLLRIGHQHQIDTTNNR